MEPQSPQKHATDNGQMTSTDSMVTVSLSDLQSNPDDTSEETREEKLADSKSLDSPQEAIESQQNPAEQEAEDDIADGTEEKVDSSDRQPETEASPAAAPQNEEDESNSLHSTSAGSDSVDWDELDKTEEQEPRSEATDEVSSIRWLTRMKQFNHTNTDDDISPLLYF